jgi:hypothetical protein
MRFPDLLVKVIELEQRIVSYEKDISYCLNQIRKIKADLDAVRSRDPETGETR